MSNIRLSSPSSSPHYCPVPTDERLTSDGDSDGGGPESGPFSDHLPNSPSKEDSASRCRPPWTCGSWLMMVMLLVFFVYMIKPPTPEETSKLFSLSSGRIYDLEETWRGVGLNKSESLPSEPKFLLARLGYGQSVSLEYANITLAVPNSTIPSILHIIPPGKETFGFIQWLSISSALRFIKPDRLLVHVVPENMPNPGSNFWWDQVLKMKTKRVVEILPTQDVTELFSRPIHDTLLSQKTDIMRMKVLAEWGGVYVNSDVLVLQSFETLMKDKEDEVVMGIEMVQHGDHGPRQVKDEKVEVEGLCSNVMLAKHGSPFLKMWWNSYHDFDGDSCGDSLNEGGSWNYHSVQLPWLLAKKASHNQTPVTLLDHRAFSWPLSDDTSLYSIHGTVYPQDSETVSSSSSTSSSSSPFQRKLRGRRLRNDDETQHDANLIKNIKSSSSSSSSKTTETGTEMEILQITTAKQPQNQSSTFGQAGYDLRQTGQYTYNMHYQTLAERINIITRGDVSSIEDLGPDDVWSRESSFNWIAREYLNQEVTKEWKLWQQQQIGSQRHKGSRRRS